MRHRHSVTENPAQIGIIAAFAALIGAATAMLFTPRSGPQIRNGIRRRADNVKDGVQGQLNIHNEDTADTTQNEKQVLEAKTNKIANDVKTTAAKAKSKAKAAASKVETSGRKISKDVSDKL